MKKNSGRDPGIAKLCADATKDIQSDLEANSVEPDRMADSRQILVRSRTSKEIRKS